MEDLKYDERGLIPAIVQDAQTHEVLTLAYMNAESLKRTLEEGETWFWSRSRQQLWHKGETSGHTQRVVEVRLDCDADALVLLVEPVGPACHTGQRSCFYREVEGLKSKVQSPKSEVKSDDEAGGEQGSLGDVLEGLYALIERRKEERPAGSYTTYLFNEGLDKILKKVGEESAETIIAAKNREAQPLVSETSDLLYHLIVLLVERGVRLDDVRVELAGRSGKRRAR